MYLLLYRAPMDTMQLYMDQESQLPAQIFVAKQREVSTH